MLIFLRKYFINPDICLHPWVIFMHGSRLAEGANTNGGSSSVDTEPS